MKKIVLNFSLLLSFSFLFAQSPLIQWQTISSISQTPKKIILTNDNGYLVLSSKGAVNNITNCNLIKLDSNGNILWERILGGSNNDDPVGIIQTNDGGYMLIASTQSNDGDVSGNHNANVGNSLDVWIVKLNNLGIIQWQKCLGSEGSDYAKSIKQTIDGGYIVAASAGAEGGDVTGLHSPSTTDYWIVKLNSTGIIEWQKCFGGNSLEEASDIIETVDGGYIVIGDSYSNISGDVTMHYGLSDFWIVKMNSLGILEWQKSYGSLGFDRARGIVQTLDGNYIIGGGIDENTGIFNTYGKWRFLKLDTSGNIIWNKSLPGQLSIPFSEMKLNPLNGHVFVIGSDYSQSFYPNFNINIEVNNLDQNGNFIWKKIFGGTSYDYGIDLAFTSDNAMVILGDASSADGDILGNTQQYAAHTWVAKLFPQILSINEVINSNTLFVFPNPVKDFLYINSEDFNQSKITIYDNLGRMVLDNLDYNYGINLSVLTSGFYFIDFKNEKGEILKRKILKE